MNRLRKIIYDKCLNLNHFDLEIPTNPECNNLTQPTVHLTFLSNKADTSASLRELKDSKYDESFVRQVRILPETWKSGVKLEYELKPEAFVEATLDNEDIIPNTMLNEAQHVVFDFSSPNIAKPFHVGHLRSTIIGNVLSNLHEYLGYKVTKINYLGDWGTQFGMLQVGVEQMHVTDGQLKQQPIETLYKAYVMANKLAKSDSTIMERARQYFSDLETGTNSSLLKQWQQYRLYTIEALEKVYLRLGVHFDAYEWESQYSQRQISDVLSALEANALLHDEPDGRKVLVVHDRRIPVVKSDGSTLYLTRDIAALLDRWNRIKFHRIFYVVEKAQTDHFNALFETTASLCGYLTKERMVHVKFGRIRGMSTRSGNVVFLSDILNEARNIMLEKQVKSPTTKIDVNSTMQTVTDILGVTAVIVNDLKQRRQRDYDFDWKKVLQVNGDSGIKLQYTHCRLYSLLNQEESTNINVEEFKPNVEHLLDPEAQDLIFQLARFQQTLLLAQRELEACVLVNYLFALCNTTSRALKHLNVKNEVDLEKRRNRILLFTAAKRTLHAGLRILGLKPLNQM